MLPPHASHTGGLPRAPTGRALVCCVRAWVGHADAAGNARGRSDAASIAYAGHGACHSEQPCGGVPMGMDGYTDGCPACITCMRRPSVHGMRRMMRGVRCQRRRTYLVIGTSCTRMHQPYVPSRPRY